MNANTTPAKIETTTPRTIALPADLYDALVAKGWLVDDTEEASE